MCPSPIGMVGDRSTPTSIIVRAKRPILPGTYIYVKFNVKDPSRGAEEEREVVGMIGSTVYKSIIPAPVVPEYSGPVEALSGLSEHKIESEMQAFIVADITGGRAQPPRYPPPPETPIYLAKPKHLKPIYSFAEEGGIVVGSLVGFEDMRVSVDANALPRHVLIAGTTGSGKSNFVAVLADRIAQIGGSVVIFDVHGEYENLEAERPEKVKVINIGASINPLRLPHKLLVSLIIPESQATKQRRILITALKSLHHEIMNKANEENKPHTEVIKELYKGHKMGESENQEAEEETESVVDKYKELLIYEAIEEWKDNKALGDVIGKIDFFFEEYGDKINFESLNISEYVGHGRIVVVNASTLVDELRDIVLKIIAEDLLKALKSNSIPYTMLIVEEAHLFLRAGASTWSRQTLQRFAREGRKFGAMLAIVSQRPRALDVDVASQVQNFAFFRLVQDKDKEVVMDLTDVLSGEQLGILPSLPPGQGIFVGEWVRWYPVYVKVDLHKGKKKGGTPDVLESWRKGLGEASERVENWKSLASEWEG